ncbi:MAG: endolytic transglycosylase MltG, partial [Candidatus Margulisbacteria bacterium]|nr:endolytic transglycosylase MltG [Candidatus Margulisiibacteriota bacterium]
MRNRLKKYLNQTSRYLRKNRRFWQREFYRYVLPAALLLALWSTVFLGADNNFSRRTFLVKVPKNSTAQEVLSGLHANGLLRNKFNTRLAVRLGRFDRQIHAGEFVLAPSMSLKRIMETLGERHGLSLTSSKQVVIPEGYSLQEI